MPEVNVEAMNEHLAVISQCISVGAIAVLVLDNAGWHTSPRLKLPDNIITDLCAGVESNRKCLGVPARQLAQPLRVAEL